MSFEGKNVVSPSERTEIDMTSDIRTIKRVMDDRFLKVYGQDMLSDFDNILKGVRTVRDKESDLTTDISEIKELVDKLTGKN